MSDPLQPLRLAVAMVTAIAFLVVAVAARGSSEPASLKRPAKAIAAH
jgi:hypothetical protein